MPYSPDSKLTYPYPFHPKNSLELFLVSNRTDAPDELYERDLYATSARDLLSKYTDSHLGKWQSEQAPRYPNFHRDLPEYALPYDNTRTKSYQHTFGRILLKTMAHFGHSGIVSEDNHQSVEKRYPMIDVSDVIEPSDTQASDFHPVGHMVRTSVVLHETLRLADDSRFELPRFAKYLTRCAMALHDIGENEHPGVLVETGTIVGDISAAEGKTDANRAQERIIFESIMREEFAEYFDSEMIEIMSALVGHRIHELSPDYVAAHSVQEIAHNLNSAKTGIFAANLGMWCAQTLARHNDDNGEGIYIIGHSMAMAEQHVTVLKKKFGQIAEETPELAAFYDQATVTDTLQHLHHKAHALDDNPQFIAWRTSEPIVKRYGEYQPVA